jgi:pyrroloquinoline quinone biosynthesis protein B
MKSFLEENAPFTQLIKLNNIKLELIEENAVVQLNKNISITPFLVPHRNEFSETVGYSIQSTRKKVLYIPDIDAWDDWEMDINKMIKKHDIAFLDGTFYDKNELKSRNIKDVPHPSIKESIKRFSPLVAIDRKKVNFTHLNHTNKVLRQNSEERNEIIAQGFQVASDGMVCSM